MNPKTILSLLLSPLATLLLVAAPAAQAQFIYSTNDGTITIDGYTGSGGALTIPIRINGLPVTSIGTSAFISLTSLTSVTIPDSVTSIGDSAFAYCIELTSVYFTGNAPTADATVFSSDNNATIYYDPGTTGWSNTFAGRPAVAESAGEAQFTVTTNAGKITITGYSGPNAVIIPSTINGRMVTRIGGSAFINMSSLTSVTIPSGVTSIGDSAFAYCTGLANVTIPTSVTTLGTNVFFASGLTSVTIPESVTSIPGDAFAYCTNLASVTIPGNVTSIGTNAFAYCSGLTNVTIPDSVRSIGEAAFGYCNGLTNVTIPGSVRVMGGSVFAFCDNLAGVTLAYGVTNIGANAFGYCGSLASVTIPDSVTNIGQYAFFECSNLASVTIPKKVRSIGDDAFAYCTGLASVTISNGLTNIGVSAFYYCTGLPSVTIPGSVRSIGGDTFAYCASLASVTISNGVHSIGGDAFAYCPILASVAIPDSVTNIGVSAFYSCSSLSRVTIPGSVRSIADDTFAYCTSLASVTISNGVHGIGEDAFYGCSSLATITIPDSITNIGVSAFYSCSNLASITIPNSVRGIGDDAFAYCASLASVTISNGVRSIGEDAFLSCSKLTSITIPSSVTNVGEWAFEYCSNLTSVFFGGHAPTADSTAFSGDSNGTIYYLPGTAGWSATFAGLPAYTVALQVTLGPAAAITAGAQWQVDGGTWQNSAASVGNLSVGNHTLGFNTISGWTTPSNQTAAIKANSVAKSKGTYTFSAQGIYNGLFMQAEATEETAGMLRGLDVTASGTYSGKLLTGGANYAISGGFDGSGQASNEVQRTAKQGGPLTLVMTLHWNDSPPNISGTVSGSNGAWMANLTNELALKEGSSSAEYTACMLPDGTPPGYGYMLITNHEGTFTLSVTLADGTSFSQAVPLSGAGDLPVYGNLYGGTGLLLGWIGLQSGSLSGNLTWIKPASRSTVFYTNGFTNLVLVQGSPWTSPSPNTAAIDLPSGQLAISGGSLLTNLAFNVAVSNNNALVKLAGGSTNSLTGSINPKTGLLTLTFGNGAGKSTTAGTGAVLQNVTNAAGFFLGKTNAGSIVLQP
jgi:archaellum component FlaG (FlaF/FlaG flagellin family)